MTLVHLHLLLNHLPLVGVPLAGLLLFLGIVRRERVLVRTALAFMIGLALAAAFVFVTGDPAEEAVEHLPGIVDRTIDRHEDLATVAVWATTLLGVLSVAALLASRHNRPVPRALAVGTLALTVVTAGLLAATGYSGGQIRHTEISPAAAPGVNATHEGR